MWLLKDNNGKIIYLKVDEPLTVGRKKGSLVLNDDSVSRNHAVITVTKRRDIAKIENNAEPLSVCKLTDSGSKYGSYILRGDNPDSWVTTQGNSLQHMDKIRFGVQNSIFTVTYVPIITATSGLDNDEKNELRKIIDTIDGSITLGWEAVCTHMTISKPNVSEKLTCALAFGIPIVPLDFWRGVLEAFKANEELPDFEKFTRLIDAKLGLLGNISVRPDPRRRTLFQNLTFVHYDSGQYNVHRRMIESAGGKSVLGGNRAKKDINVCNDDVIVVQLIESSSTQATGTGDANYMTACEQLGKCRRRAIPSSEIALAIFHCSTKKCCNPKYDHAGMFKKSDRDQSEKSSILALDTQDVDLPPAPCYKKVSRVNAPPTVGSLPRSDFIKESVEEETKVDSQNSETIPKESRNDDAANSNHSNQPVNPPKIGASAGHDESASQFDEASLQVASLKITSLNHEEGAIHESNVGTEAETNQMKRRREEHDDDDDVAKKRVRGTTLMNCKKTGKETTPEEDVPRVDATSADIVGNFIKKKLSVSEPERHFAKAPPGACQAKIETKSGRSDAARINPLISEDQPPLRETDHGRPVQPSLLRDVTKGPFERKKTMLSSPTKKPKLSDKPEPGQSTLMNYLSPKKKNRERMEWTPAGKCNEKRQRYSTALNATSSTATADTSSSSRGSRTAGCDNEIYDPNPSVQPLLRTDSSINSSALSTLKFGKSFRKGYKANLRRIEFDDSINVRSWSKDKNISGKHVSPDEGSIIKPRKISPSSSNKMFRV